MFECLRLRQYSYKTEVDMSYILKTLHLFDRYSFAILPALGFALILFGVINWLYNPYRKQNRSMRACIKSIRVHPDRAPMYVCSLPNDYRRQWRAFVNCGTDRPSLVFEFVPKSRKLRGLWLFIPTTVVSALFIVVFVLIKHNYAYLVFQCAYLLAFGLIMIANKVIWRRYERRAKQTFAQFVSLLNKVTPKSDSAIVEETVQQLKKLNRQQVNDKVVGKASELLHSKGLETDRTVEQQRRLNNALNGLLQAYANGAKHSKI